MIREDRELLAGLARLTTAVASLGMRIMERAASVVDQQDYVGRLTRSVHQAGVRGGRGVAAVVPDGGLAG